MNGPELTAAAANLEFTEEDDHEMARSFQQISALYLRRVRDQTP